MDTQVLKSKVVFVGDQSVGKTSVINRFIFDNYTGNEQVPLLLCSPPSESISFPRPSRSRIKRSEFNCGILPGNRGFIP